MIMHPEGVPARVFCDPFGVVSLFLLLLRGCRPYGLNPRLIAVSPPGSCGEPKTGQQSRANLDALTPSNDGEAPLDSRQKHAGMTGATVIRNMMLLNHALFSL